jgi:antitoxin VapB
MQTAKLFQNGRSQAVRLPKEYQFNGTDVFIHRVGESVILFPKNRVWETFLHGLGGFTEDFMPGGREQPKMPDRENV